MRLRFKRTRRIGAVVLGLSSMSLATCGVSDLLIRDFFTTSLIQAGVQAVSSFVQASIIGGDTL